LLTGNVGQGLNTQPIGNNISNIKYVLDNNKMKLARKEFFLIHFADIAKGLNYRFQASSDNPTESGFLFWDPTHGDGRGSNGRLQNVSSH
jgi:hypothetical protein